MFVGDTELNRHLYRSQTKFAKVMFSQVFVCPGEGSGGVSVQGRSLSRGDLCPGGGLCPEGSQSSGGLCNVRTVHILLECILVINLFSELCEGSVFTSVCLSTGGISVRGWGCLCPGGSLFRPGGFCLGVLLSGRPPVR